ncbi:MAG: DUF3263 domain-containing protein [Rhodococcus sp. (in: high G+C Gram-positive bacteria)]|nr:MAG: DUF3263 domain-containing protein [Rhodococcus sp. (in: high G+C Gram-positive bacteria)]
MDPHSTHRLKPHLELACGTYPSRRGREDEPVRAIAPPGESSSHPTAQYPLVPQRQNDMTEDQTMLDFARIWAPYGGAPARDIFVTFGMSAAQFYENISRILRTLAARQIPEAEWCGLKEIASRHRRVSGDAGVGCAHRRGCRPLRCTCSPRSEMSSSTRRRPCAFGEARRGEGGGAGAIRPHSTTSRRAWDLRGVIIPRDVVPDRLARSSMGAGPRRHAVTGGLR